MGRITKRLDIYLYGVRKCNGSCRYCCAKNAVDSPVSDQWFDKQAVRSRIDEAKPEYIMIWGAEPLLHFSKFKSLVDFLKQNYPRIKLSTSSNGLLLDNYYEWLIANNISVQLSHDALGQSYRTDREIIDSQGVVKLAKAGLIYINCVYHKYNSDLKANVDFFEAWKSRHNIDNVDIRFSPLMTGDNIVDGEDVQITDPNFTEQLEYLWHTKYSRKLRDDAKNFKLNSGPVGCFAYARGKIHTTSQIDTLGRYCSCNLLDSSQTPANYKGLKPPYCWKCKYVNSNTCNQCVSLPRGKTPCIFQKMYNEFLESTSQI